MEIINLVFVLIFAYEAYHIFKDNHLKIQAAKRMISEIKLEFSHMSNTKARREIIDINLEKINENISCENRYLDYIIPLNVLGIIIFYIYFETSTSILMSTITSFLVVSYSSVKKNYMKTYHIIKNLV